MSRIGKQPVTVPAGVTYSEANGVLTVKGPKGELTQALVGAITLSTEDGKLLVSRINDEKQSKALHGLYRSLISNMMKGVSEGFKAELELVGVGYRATYDNGYLELALGYSHPVVMTFPKIVKVSAAQEKGLNPKVTLECVDKQLLGMLCAKIRSFRKSEPYKGKGIKFAGEVLRRKAGKTASKK